MITIDQLKDVKERTDALYRYLGIEEKKIQVEEEQLRTQAPGFWDDQKAAEAQMKKVKGLQQWIAGYQDVKTLADELQLAYDFYKDELVSEAEVDDAYAKAVSAIEELELKNMLRSEADQMDCVLKINSGAGGTESQDWASMLMRMYMRWAEANGYKLSVANLQEGDEAGIKSVTMNIEGAYAYGYLKGENGVHRLVRVSPYNAQGKRMTSFASVFVTPLVDDSIEVTIEPARLSWDTFRSGGAGGQNVNKVESGVRLRYQYKDPYTGEEEEILIENTETRDQPKNKENAMRQLRSILYDKELKHRMEEQAKVEAGKKKIEWGSQIRSYVFDDRRVKDHRTNYQTSDVNGVMDGKIDGFIKAYLMEFADKEV
ncbi:MULTISPECIES: peptide chain release factor 2 [Bacteroides]|uniref:Peptide chain release factor 2 n=2 Tax=Bacteroidaceae TaxID=815 RepID=A0ABT7VGW2_9BACE|nr:MULTISPECIES: peptide chain release factor 2 [Bacteroides]MBU3854948.1 peptide chain release factor 2 [Candidatus Phocaeicola excrementipullorum]MBW9199747.1 peptide chain release factor 2 [Bacteroidales bacterium SW299]MCR8917060.1 peptide chain release factor 2 [Bacteroides sp. ET225]MDM8208471.1 peptide chain release factor 2 [Bacteroides gallinaceum]MDM8325523.1 peptide chain release factor 2 [Bacteroides gallinaceum]